MIPPADCATERAVLDAVLTSSEYFDEVADLLTPAHWYDPANALVWQACVELRAANEPIDLVTVNRHLATNGQRVRPTYLAEIADSSPAVANVRSHAQTVVNLWRLRESIRVCHESAAAGYQAAGDVPGHLERLESDVFALGCEQAGTEATHIREATEASFRAIQARAEAGGLSGISTGFDALDRTIGGLGRGDLVVVAARPGMGKSAFATNITRSAAREGAVAVFSLEMPKSQIADRFVAAESRVDLRRMRQGRLTESEWRDVASAGAAVSQLPIWIDDRPALTVTQIRSAARRRASDAKRNGGKLAAVVVDYLQLMGSAKEEGKNREQEISEISRGMKATARALDVPVVLLSQLNRSVESRSNKTPQLSDLRESGAIEQDADVVLFLVRPGYYLEQQGKSDDTGGETALIVAKQRNGPTGTERLRWYGGCASFREWSE